MRSLSAAYLLRQVWRLARKDACGIVSLTPPLRSYVISQSTVCARMEKAPTECEVRLGLFLAEKVGFEPTRRFHVLRDFESRLFDHLSTSPYYLIVGILIENCRLLACVAVDQNP